MVSDGIGRSEQGAGRGTDSFLEMFAANPTPMWVYDRQTLAFLAVNDSAVARYGYGRQQFLSLRLPDITPESERRRLLTELALPRPPLQWSGPWIHKLADGSLIEVEILSHEVSYANRPAILVTAQDSSEHSPPEPRVRRIERHDSLTGLADRGFFLTQMDLLAPRGGLIGVLLLDLDGFAALNDAYGYDAGDEVLRDVGRSIATLAYPVVARARIGADQFAVAAVVAVRADAIALAEEIARRARRATPEHVTTTVTIGVALQDEASATPAELLREATIATRWAKRHRRGGIAVADESFARHAIEQITIERDLRAAIRAGELILFYQPVIDLAEGRVAGSEALLRWERPGHGLITPGQFIPSAEASGLIRDMWPRIIDQAVGDTARWQKQTGNRLSVAVNLSARQFDDPSTIDHLVNALNAHGIDPADVIVEITETAAVEDPHRMHEIISAFRLLGVRVALDDFGTGYSSLVYLEHTPFDIIKIDRVFITRIATDQRQRSMVSGVVKLAHTLGMTVVAEGVEQPDQLTHLTHLGVEQAQGYHLGRPTDATTFASTHLANPYPV
jgi:diguanylate cyclase (GGDEF)-like protein/PAS domain S-box-containing protein